MGLRVVVAGGGTAGHVEPALNLADAVKAMNPDAVVTAIGTAEGLETRLVPARGYELDLIEQKCHPGTISELGMESIVGFQEKRKIRSIHPGKPVILEIHEKQRFPWFARRKKISHAL